MSLAQVQLGVVITMALLFSWAAMVTVVALALPTHARRAENALDRQPKRCLFTGLLMLAFLILGFVLLGQAVPLVKLAGFILSLCMGVLLLVGGAGIAHLMGTRIGEMSGAKSSFGALVRGSIVHGFSMIFPYLGWFLMLPLSLLCALGAGWYAIAPKRYPALSPLPQEGTV